MKLSAKEINNSSHKNKLVDKIPTIFNTIVNNNITQGALKKKKYSIFDSKKAHIHFDDYVERLVKHTEIEANTLLYCLILVDLFHERSKVAISEENKHKIFLVSLITSLKFLEDVIYSDKELAVIAGISTKSIAILENEFLECLDYKVNISHAKFDLYYECFFSN